MSEWHKISVWYPYLSLCTFPTLFVRLDENELHMLASGNDSIKDNAKTIARLNKAMRSFPGNCFVSADTTAPTDTERFRDKAGAIHSAESAWRVLSSSRKIREAAANGDFEFIAVRPFRRLGIPKEFRLFIHGRKLKAMSQLWLTRHFKRIEGVKDELWLAAQSFVNENFDNLPDENLTMDIYFTSHEGILVIDLNKWGEPTSPLLLNKWDINWNEERGILTIPPPLRISGDVNVSF